MRVSEEMGAQLVAEQARKTGRSPEGDFEIGGGEKNTPPPTPAPAFEDEAAFLDWVRAEAKAQGWRVYHTHRSDKSEPGFPDLIMLRDGVQIAAELKRDRKQKPSFEQAAWLMDFAMVRTTRAVLWEPGDVDMVKRMLEARL